MKKKNNIKNIGFVSKKKIAKVMGKIYAEKELTVIETKEDTLRKWEVQSVLNLLATLFGVDFGKEYRKQRDKYESEENNG